MKNLIPLALFILLSCGATAQDKSDKKIYPGLKIVPTIGWFNTDISNDAKNNQKFGIENNGARFGFAYGGQIDYMFASNFGLSGEILFATYQGKFTINRDIIIGGNQNKVAVTSIYRLQYLQIPVSIKMMTNEISYMKYFGNIGLVPSFRIKAKGDIDSASNTVPLESLKDITVNHATSFFTAFAKFGGGAQYNLSENLNLVGSINYYRGLLDIYTDKKSSGKYYSIGDNQFKATPHYIAFEIGILF